MTSRSVSASKTGGCSRGCDHNNMAMRKWLTVFGRCAEDTGSFGGVRDVMAPRGQQSQHLKGL